MKVISLFLLLCFSQVVLSQSNNFRYYHQNSPPAGFNYGSPEVKQIVRTSDKGYIISMFPWRTNIHSIYPFDTYTIKTDSNFVPLWKKPYFAKAIALPTGGVILLYNTSLTNHYYNGFQMEKISASGAHVWTKNVSGDHIILNDGVLYGGDTIRFVGRKIGNGGFPLYTDVSVPFTMVTDTSGNLISQSAFSTSSVNVDFSGIKRDASGNFYVYGEFDPTSMNELVLAKFSRSFTPVWSTRYTSNFVPLYIEDIDVLPNGRIFATGMVMGNSLPGIAECALFKFSAQGAIVQAKFLQGTYMATSMCKTPQGNYIISANRGDWYNDSLITFETDTAMNISWHRYRATGYGSGPSVLRGNKLYTLGYDGYTPFIINSDSAGNNCSSIARPFTLLTPTNQVQSFTLSAQTSTMSITSGTYTALQTQAYSDTCKCVAFITSNANGRQLCTGVQTTVTITGTGNLSWYSSLNGSNFIKPGNSYVYSSNSPTVHTVYIQDSTCAMANRTPVTFSIANQPTLSISPPSPSICAGKSTTLQVSGAVDYLWNPVATGSLLPVSPTLTTTYSVTGFVNAGCFSTLVTTVNVVSIPKVAITNNSLLSCFGQTVPLSASGALSYSWSTGQTGSNIVVNPPLGPNTYTVTGAISTCTAIATTFLASLATPTITVTSAPSTVCPGKYAILNASGANTFTWNNSSTGSTYSVWPTSATVYTVSGTITNNSCTSTRTVIINVHPTPTITVNSGTVCSGAAYAINPAGAATYSYTGGGPLVNPVTNSTYTITGYSQFGCASAPAISSVTVVPLPSITVNSGIICAGESFTITPSGASTYSISGGNFIVSPANTSLYSVTGSNSGGCKASSVAFSTVQVNAPPSLMAYSSSSLICAGESVTLSAMGASSYTWNGTWQGNQVIANPTADTQFVIKGVGNNGCVAVFLLTQKVDLCTDLNQVSADDEFYIFPNPTTGLINLQLSQSGLTLSVYDAVGREVYHNTTESLTTSINIGNHPAGIYLVKISGQNNYSKVTRIIKH